MAVAMASMAIKNWLICLLHLVCHIMRLNICSNQITYPPVCVFVISLSHKFQVFPIFIISIADFLLALTWVVGGALWFTRISQRVWCFLPSLLTVVGHELRKSWCVANMIAHVNHLPTDLSMCHC